MALEIFIGERTFVDCCNIMKMAGCQAGSYRICRWEDFWASNQPLKQSLPRLFTLSRFHYTKIDSLAILNTFPMSWDFDFRRNLNDEEGVNFAVDGVSKSEVGRLQS